MYFEYCICKRGSVPDSFIQFSEEIAFMCKYITEPGKNRATYKRNN